MNGSPSIILSIESAICGGSISLLVDGHEIANWIGSSNVSKAEDLLLNIDGMLSANRISRKDIDLIAVSAGPGSFTGIRIGLATAFGLRSGLDVRMSSISALEAMVSSHSSLTRVSAALPVGRNAVCVQEFRPKNEESNFACKPRSMTENELFEITVNETGTIFLLHEALYENAEPAANIINFGANLAYSIGQVCRENPGLVTEPLFVSKSF